MNSPLLYLSFSSTPHYLRFCFETIFVLLPFSSSSFQFLSISFKFLFIPFTFLQFFSSYFQFPSNFMPVSSNFFTFSSTPVNLFLSFHFIFEFPFFPIFTLFFHSYPLIHSLNFVSIFLIFLSLIHCFLSFEKFYLF